MADPTQDAETRGERRDALLWFSVLAGPFAWALTEQLSYMLTPTACWTGHHFILYLVPLGTLLIVLAGALVARSRWRRAPAESMERGYPEDSRIRFMAVAGFWLCVSFAVAILAETVPNLVLRVCD